MAQAPQELYVQEAEGEAREDPNVPQVPRGCSEGAGQEQSEGMGEVAGLQCSDHFG